MAQSNYQIIRDQMRDAFITFDQQKMLQKFPLQYDANYIYIDFVSRQHRIHRKSGIVEWSADGFQTSMEAGHNASMAIYDVLCCSKEGCTLSGTYCSVNALKGTVKSANLGTGMFQRDAAGFKGKKDGLQKACRLLGSLIPTNADVAAILYPFSFLPAIIQYWEADDEFPANLTFLFDENILDFMHFETIFFMMGHIISRIKETMASL